jgi:hypothetical protein
MSVHSVGCVVELADSEVVNSLLELADSENVGLGF